MTHFSKESNNRIDRGPIELKMNIVAKIIAIELRDKGLQNELELDRLREQIIVGHQSTTIHQESSMSSVITLLELMGTTTEITFNPTIVPNRHLREPFIKNQKGLVSTNKHLRNTRMTKGGLCIIVLVITTKIANTSNKISITATQTMCIKESHTTSLIVATLIAVGEF